MSLTIPPVVGSSQHKLRLRRSGGGTASGWCLLRAISGAVHGVGRDSTITFCSTIQPETWSTKLISISIRIEAESMMRIMQPAELILILERISFVRSLGGCESTMSREL